MRGLAVSAEAGIRGAVTTVARHDGRLAAYFADFLTNVSLTELVGVVGRRMRYYNRVRRHSSLGDRPPLTIIEDFYREG